MNHQTVSRRLACLGALALLAGCATAPISVEQKLTGQEGAVVFKFITNGTSAFDAAETLSSVTIRRDTAVGAKPTAQDDATLVRSRAVTNTTAVFSGMVAPGRYRLVHATGFRGGVTYTFPMGSMSGSFEVKKGEVSLLGTLLVQPLEGTRFVVGHVPPEAELRETFEALFPALAQQTRGQTPNTFEPSPDLLRREQVSSRIRQLASAHNGLKASPDGTVLAGGKMGRVRWHRPGQALWGNVQIPTWKEVLGVSAYRGGLLAAGEEGLLRHSVDDGRTWQVLVPPDRGLIAAAEALPNGKVIALVRRDDKWSAYASTDLAAGAWRKIGSFDDERSLNVPWQSPIALASGNRVGIMMPNGVFQAVDGDRELIERSNTGVSTMAAQVMPDGMIVVQGAIVTRTTVISTDAGRTWTDLDTSRFMLSITFADRRTAYAISPVAPGMYPGAYGLMTSRDGAKTWTRTGEIPGGTVGAARSLAYDHSDKSLLAFMLDGQVLRSTDEGKTWARSM